MSDSSNETLLGDLEFAMPLFLSRAGAASRAGLVPPPLPAACQAPAAGVRGVIRSGRLVALRLAIAAGTAGAAYVFAAAAPPLTSYLGRDPGPALVEAPRPLRSRLSQALAMVAELEARLAYGVRFGDHLTAADPARSSAKSAASALAAAMAGGGEAEAFDTGPFEGDARQPSPDTQVSLLVVRNLPDGATLRKGASAGEGAWAMPAADIGELAGALGDGFDEPVQAEAEMVSPSGVTVRTARVTLQKDTLRTDKATIAISDAGTPGDGAAIATGSIEPEYAQAEHAAVEGEEHQAKPVRKRRHARTRSQAKREAALNQAPRGARYLDAWSANTAREPARVSHARMRAMGVGVGNGQEEPAQPGLIAKFVAWVKGNPAPAPAPQDTAATAPAPVSPAATTETEDTFSQFGMFQSK